MISDVSFRVPIRSMAGKRGGGGGGEAAEEAEGGRGEERTGLKG